MKSQKGVSLIVLLLIIIIIILSTFLIRNMLLEKAEKLNAEYEASFHTVTFDTDGGSKIEPMKVQYSVDVTYKIPTKEGYIFEKWLLNGEPVESSNIKVTEDITLKASYKEKNNANNSNSSNSNNGNYSNNNTNIKTPEENKKTYNVDVRNGQKNNLGEELCALTVMNYQTEAYNSQVGKVEEGQEWVIVNMKFENMSDTTIVINKNDFQIVDGAGRYGYKPYYKHLDTELDIMEIRAGQTATFSVRFVYYKNNEMILRFNHPSIVTEVYTDIKLR